MRSSAGNRTDKAAYVQQFQIMNYFSVSDLLRLFSIIAQVIIEMSALWLVEDYVISRYNHPARGDYNTEALIFKVAAARFLDVSEEETIKMKENAVALIITWAIILKQLFSSGSVNIVE